MQIKRLAIALVAVAFLSGCATGDTGKPKFNQENYALPSKISFSIVDSGVSWRATEKKMMVIDNQEDWSDLWRLLAGVFPTPVVPPEPLRMPLVDFDKELAIVVIGGGECARAEVSVKSIEEEMLFIRVNVYYGHQRRQLKDPIPYHIVKMQKTKKPIVFEESTCR